MRAAAGWVLVLALSVACASTKPATVGWQKPGGSPEELRTTASQCKESTLESNHEAGSEWIEARVMGNSFTACMKKHGWSRAQKAVQ
jgi:hypothetical protein